MITRISLDAEDFRKLVSGQIVQVPGNRVSCAIEIALKDIGFAVMREIVHIEAARHAVNNMRSAGEQFRRAEATNTRTNTTSPEQKRTPR
jgi:hypothetical protein